MQLPAISKHLAALILEKLVRLLTNLFFISYVARYLGPEKLSILSYEQSFLVFFAALAILGLDSILSKYEGFGLPIIKAMQKGCPVITANYEAMLEVAQGRAFHVDPSDPNELAKAMTKLTLDKGLRVSLVQNGYTVADRYSWQKTAVETQKVYEAVLS